MTAKYRTVILRDCSPIRYTVEETSLSEAIDTFTDQIRRMIMERPRATMSAQLEQSNGFSCKVIQTFVLS